MDETKAIELKQDFPLLKKKVHGNAITYLDNAATTQKPNKVIDAVTSFYKEHNANVHRGVYTLSQEATDIYDKARATIARFINADPEEVILTSNTTEAINLLARALHETFGDSSKREIVLTEMEHHSNLLPWQELAKREGYTLKFIKVKDDFTLDYTDAESKITDKTAILSVVHVSNTLGTINDVQRLVALGRAKGAVTVVDAAQSAPHLKVDVKAIGCDFLALSGHKMLAPTGTGALFGKRSMLKHLAPFNVGGGTIKTVSFGQTEYLDPPAKFEAGTPNIAGAAGFTAAIEYLEAIGMDNIAEWEHTLAEYALEKLRDLDSIELYHPGERSAGIISFNLKHVHAHDVVSLLDDAGICARGGHHCTMPLMTKFGLAGTVRVSFYVYNTQEDVDRLIEELRKIKEVFA